MDNKKYIGMDVLKESISIAVRKVPERSCWNASLGLVISANPGISCSFLEHFSQLPSMLIARAPTAMIVTNEIVLSSIINNLAREVSGAASVGLNAVAVSNARNR